MATKVDQIEEVEPTFDVESARRTLVNEQMDRQRRAARRLQEFVETLQQEERCVVRAVPFYTADGRTDAQIAVNALPME